ncbi:helix-turn-helix transcriptional regulator [Weissella confusa]|uniref:helix-turn-helix transcriptional regulator n=1 Tax=Weissella confusa TaxID=1583 RepID=UPI000DCA55FD|nr:helix-turn-helix transcriptional regulator [Weissella confusa]QYU57495.1 helix-turn-helix transcriptional regulator [Weissella confusa]RAU06612.1 hypothetical protein DEJ53_07295 [Weissella confusa]TGE61740.1 hypothetical protein C6P21_02315 [Weissella confusa]
MTNRIAELRTQNNESQTDIAKLLGTSRQAVSLYEKGDREPKLETWVKLANHFGVSVGYITGVSNDKHDFYGGTENEIKELTKQWNEFADDDAKMFDRLLDLLVPESSNDLKDRLDIHIKQKAIVNLYILLRGAVGQGLSGKEELLNQLDQLVSDIWGSDDFVIDDEGAEFSWRNNQ